MKMDADPRSGQLMESAELAVFLRARSLLLENVYNLVEMDSAHKLLSTVTARLGQAGYSQVRIWKLRHDHCSGGSQIPRVFIFWLEDEAALSLSPLDDCARDVTMVEATPIRHFLRHSNKVPSESYMPWEFVPTSSDADSDYGEEVG